VARALALTILVAVGLASALFAFGALSNLWADYQDSSTSTYLIIGLPFLALALACGWVILRLVRDR
jgi:hypothetical protein